jgi:hypothetical protein
MKAGVRVDAKGDSINQALMLDALVDGYEATGEPAMLIHAQNLAAAIRTVPTWPTPDPHRDITARPFLRLAEAQHGPIGRLEVEFPITGGRVIVRRTDGSTVFNQLLSTHAAVVYLPRARYRVELQLGTSRSVSLNVTAEGTNVSFSSSASTTLLQGFVLRDLDDDGLIDAGDVGAIQSRAYLDTNNDGNFTGSEPSQVIGSNGFFSLAVVPSTYTVRAVPPAGGWRWTRSSPNPIGSSPGHNVQFHTGGLTVQVHSFMATTRTRVSGKVFHDMNSNGVQGTGEKNITESFVYFDTNNNSVRDFGEPYTATGLDGSFSIGNLGSNGRLRIVTRSALPVTTLPSGGNYLLSFSSLGQHLTGKNFGIR